LDAFLGARLQLTCIGAGPDTSGFSARANPQGVANRHSNQPTNYKTIFSSPTYGEESNFYQSICANRTFRMSPQNERGLILHVHAAFRAQMQLYFPCVNN